MTERSEGSLVGASPFDQRLYGHIVEHVMAEAGLLERYRRLAESSDEPDVAYLASLILEDEERHHRLFQEMANGLRSEVEWREVSPAMPEVPYARRGSEAIREVARELLEVEKEDRRQLRVLAKELDSVRHTTLWALVVELMELDTAKHIRILEFVLAHADGGSGAPRRRLGPLVR
jgi:rubrerythrin